MSKLFHKPIVALITLIIIFKLLLSLVVIIFISIILVVTFTILLLKNQPLLMYPQSTKQTNTPHVFIIHLPTVVFPQFALYQTTLPVFITIVIFYCQH